jgi:hypothetical protein
MRVITPFTTAIALGIAGTVYTTVVRPWYRYWGATTDELTRAMPLDDRVAAPTLSATRAITIQARPEQIWPWIVQMGEPPRAGYYSYTWIERLQGLAIENTDRVLPEFQTLQAGDRLDRAGDMTVLAVEPGHWVALGPPERVDWLKSTWVMALYPVDEHSTRLVIRLRARLNVLGMLRALPPLVWPFWLLIEPGIFIMERKMMLEIKRHAERQATDSGLAAMATVGEPQPAVASGSHA